MLPPPRGYSAKFHFIASLTFPEGNRRENRGRTGTDDAEERKDRGIAAAAAAENNNVQNTKLVRVINKMGPKRGRPAARDEHGSNMLRVQIKSIGSIGRFKYIKEIAMGAPHEGRKKRVS